MLDRTCSRCGEKFMLTDEDIAFYSAKGYKLPKRCPNCRKEERQFDKFVEDEIVCALIDKKAEEQLENRLKVKYSFSDKPLNHGVKTLIIVGNGFDLWQGLKSAYFDFYRFYEKNKINISQELGIEPLTITDGAGYSEKLTQFDLLYFVLSGSLGEEDFWHSFEDSLALLDDVRINGYFGKETDDLKDIRLDCDYAFEVIRECFIEWVKQIEIPTSPDGAKYDFRDALIVNFNYTDSLVKLFGADPNDIIHIHGRVGDRQSIVFGHGEHVSRPDISVVDFGSRFAGAYIVETILRRFAKKPEKQWQLFLQRLKNKHAELSAVEETYVLGHGLGKADEYYFRQLKKMLPPQTRWRFSYKTDADLARARSLVKRLKIERAEFFEGIAPNIEKFRL